MPAAVTEEPATAFCGTGDPGGAKAQPDGLSIEVPTAALVTDDAALEAGPVLEVWIFGSLASLAKCRNFTVRLAAPMTVRTLVNDMAQRFGAAFRDRILQDNGELYGYCRLFLDGFPLTKLDDPIPPKPGRSNLELIVLTSSEGG